MAWIQERGRKDLSSQKKRKKSVITTAVLPFSEKTKKRRGFRKGESALREGGSIQQETKRFLQVDSGPGGEKRLRSKESCARGKTSLRKKEAIGEATEGEGRRGF